MKIVLLKDVDRNGKAGDILDVADGYFRNFLYPKNLAKIATKQAIKEISDKNKSIERGKEIEHQTAIETAKKIENQTVEICAQAGETGKLYGSVTAMDVSTAVKEKFGVNIDKHKISLESDIRSFGDFECHVKLFPDVSARLFINVHESS
ncbi:MAG: 50S ribosomal protein L9 [Oscillospiraceae bacterium]|nr:50S ribosomal protein L9 [Oscillospiraceae bacterium]